MNDIIYDFVKINKNEKDFYNSVNNYINNFINEKDIGEIINICNKYGVIYAIKEYGDMSIIYKKTKNIYKELCFYILKKTLLENKEYIEYLCEL